MTVLSVLRNNTLSKPNEDNTSYYDDEYWYFKTYWSPAFEARQYQETLSEFEYASWMLDYIFNETIEMDYLSPFSANPTTMATKAETSRIQADRTTLFEMEVLEILSSTVDRYLDKFADVTYLNCSEQL